MAFVLAFILLAAVVLTGAVCDWRTGKVPNRLTYPAIGLGLLFWAVIGLTPLAAHADLAGPGDGLWKACVGLTAALVPMAAIFLSGGLGGGDVKLMTAVGALSGDWKVVLAAGVYALLAAAVAAVVVMIRRGLVKQTFQRIAGAALVAGTRVKPDMPTDSPRIAFAVAIAFGAILAGSEHLLGISYPWSHWGP